MKTVTKTTWHDETINALLHKTCFEKMRAVGVLMRNDVVQSMREHGGLGRPSPPGKPPAVQSGRLAYSISWACSEGGKGGATGEDPGITPPAGSWPLIRTIVGTTVAYGRRHELGIDTPSRPFLRPALDRASSWGKKLFRR